VVARAGDVEERSELPSVTLIEGFGVIDEAVAERRPDGWSPWKIGALLVAACAVVALAVSLLLGDGDEAVPEPTTTVPPPSTSAAPPRTTLPPPVASDVAQLPGVRPSATLIALAEGELYELDLLTGQARRAEQDVQLDRLFDLDGDLVALAGRELVRLDPEQASVLPILEGVMDVAPGHGPASIVSIGRDGNGVVARVLGADGVFRAGARLPGEAIVHGAVGDRLVVELAGAVVITDGTDDEGGVVALGTGRVLALGADRVVWLSCEVSGCVIVVSDAAGTVVGSVPVPDVLAAAAPDRWTELGLLSPDGRRIAIRLTHGNGSVRGVVVVDLETGAGVHSPELGIELGRPAWSPDSRFVLYPFDGDLMVWDVTAADGQLPSGRAILRIPLSDVLLR
jgi:hypothetical protein